MKNLFLTLLITSTLTSTGVIFPSEYFSTTQTISIMDEKSDKYNITYNSIFNNMMKGMNNAPNTENVNLDFVTEMIPHHEGGINMAQAIIRFGSNPDVKKIAENIVKSQEAQIPLMEELKAKFEKESPSSKENSENYLKKYNKIKNKMFKEMQGVKVANNADTTFLKQMIYHHEGAIDMAKNILKYTKDPALTKLAENIIYTQSKGISEMKSLLKQLYNN